MLRLFSRNTPRFILSGFVILVIFYIFSFTVKEDLFTKFDFDTTVRIQNVVPRTVDPFFSYFSLLGSFEITFGILIILAAIRRKIKYFLLLPSFVIMHFVELAGKAFLDHPSTPFAFHRYSFDFVFPTGYVQPGGSYPSGHSMRTAYLAVLFIFMISRTKLSPTLKLFSYSAILAILFLMLFSRLSLGEHWTTDVIGGSLLGAAFAIFSLIFI